MITQRCLYGGKSRDVTKKFILHLFKEALFKKSKKCVDKLKEYVDDNFEYKDSKNIQGLKQICRDLGSIHYAFSDIKLSVTHFKEYEKNSYTVIIIVIGKMTGYWLDIDATNKLERVGIVLEIQTKQEKVKKIEFRKEFLSEKCFSKIKALDLLHTSFDIQNKHENTKNENTKNEKLQIQENIYENNIEENEDNEETDSDEEENEDNEDRVVNVASESVNGFKEDNEEEDNEELQSELNISTSPNVIPTDNQNGGYYVAVNEIPIAGRPVYKPYFNVDGTEYNKICHLGGRHTPIKSYTLLKMKDGVVYSISTVMVQNISNDVVRSINLPNIKDHLDNYLRDNAQHHVKNAIENGISSLAGIMKGGGNILGSLGTILFPAGNTIKDVTPWLLTLGLMLRKKIENDIYKTKKGKPLKEKIKTKKPKKASKKAAKKPTKKAAKKPVKKAAKKPAKVSNKWKPLTNSEIKKLMKGGFPCGDESLYQTCHRPDWGLADYCI